VSTAIRSMPRGWNRRGLVVRPPEGAALWVTHAQAPTQVELHPELWRIYVSGRDRNNLGRIFAVDVAPHRAMAVVKVHTDPVLPLGASGAFDEAGMGPSCALWQDGKILLFYTGALARRDVTYPLSIGLAISDDGLAFRRQSEEPIVTTGPEQPLFVSTPWVGPAPEGFQMLYMSGESWVQHETGPSATYNLRRLVSPDLGSWRGPSTLLLGVDDGVTHGLTRPWVSRHRGCGAWLWFSRRGADFRRAGDGAYRIEGLPFQFDADRIGEPSEPIQFANPPVQGDFDDWMQSYACVASRGEERIMFYNGNDFGRDGFGWASWLPESVRSNSA
jgi:hypothetical protein